MHQIADIEGPVRYQEEVLESLLEFGVAPTEDTQPRVPYQFLRALMTLEIRGCKARRRELERFFGPQPLNDYAREIEALREKFALLRRPPSAWLADTEDGQQSLTGWEQTQEHEQDEGRADPAQEEAPDANEACTD